MSIRANVLISRRCLEREFRAVRKEYFPKWDKARKWRVRCFPANRVTSDCHAYCDCKGKIIYIARNSGDLTALLIHEISHAVTPQVNHGGPWQERMLKAACVGRQRRRAQLAEFLRGEVDSYRRNTEVIANKAISSEIGDCVSDLKGIPSFRAVVKIVAQRNVMTAKEFLKRFPRAKAAYDEAVQLTRGS